MKMKFFENISLRKKLLLIVLVPLISLIAFNGMKIMQLHEQTVRQTNIVKLMDISVSASNLVHELQKERGASAGFIGSKGQKFADAVPAQRLSTDTKRAALQDLLSTIDTADFGEEYNVILQSALQDLTLLDQKRTEISALELPLSEAVGYYSNMNKHFLAITKQAIFAAQEPDIIRDASAYLYFLQSKERAGIERAVGAAGFGGGWTPALRDRFSGLIKVQETYIDVFLSFSTPAQRAFFEKESSDPSFKAVDDLRKIALSSTAGSVDAEYWFKTITSKINVLKGIEDYFANDVKHLATAGAEKAANLRNIYIAILVAGLTVVLMLTYIIVADILRSIHQTEYIMNKLSEGDAAVDVVGVDRKDEIGGMARSIAIFKQSLIEKQEMEKQAHEIQQRAEEEKQLAMENLATEFDTQVGSLINALSTSAGRLQSTAENMRGIADTTSQSSQTVVASSEEASSNVNSVASAMEEMTASSQEITSQINNTRTRSNDTETNAHDANDTVENLNKLVGNIGEVVNAIRDIADQTNLLALNATIEAARAGDAGKGFAVVADEVKKLATETSKKTDEIEHRIVEIQGATTSSVEAMQRIIKNVSEINEAITAVSSAAEEQNATNSEITRSIAEASQGVQNVSQIMTDVQRGAGETGTSADAVLAAATEVTDLSKNLEGSVGKFLQSIRSGKAA